MRKLLKTVQESGKGYAPEARHEVAVEYFLHDIAESLRVMIEPSEEIDPDNIDHGWAIGDDGRFHWVPISKE